MTADTPCTFWYRFDPINGWAYNHLELGHSHTKKPMPKFPSQQGWLKATWKSYQGILTNDTPSKALQI